MSQNYCGQNLQGRSFKGQNLAGANFSKADLRGANFHGANLRGANFTDAKFGLQKRWALLLILLSCLVSGILGFLFLINELCISFIFDYSQDLSKQSMGWGALIATIIACIITGQGMRVDIFRSFTFTFTTVGIAAIAITIARNGAGIGFAFFYAATFTGTIAVVVILATALAAAFTIGRVIAVAIIVVVIIAESVVVARIVVEAETETFTVDQPLAVAVAVVIAGTVAVVVVSACIAWQAMRGDEKYALIRNATVAFAAIGGTSFRRADLTDANFTSARLKSTDLRRATLTRTCFQKTKLLDQVRPGTSYLKYPYIRKLLSKGQEQDKNFNHLDLRGINLKGGFLEDASFIGTDLSKACLQDADLSRAKLVQTQLDGTDFTGATLTGAYIEDWGITSMTKFHGVRCEYVYMRLPSKEDPDPWRKPDNREEVFADGEFGDFIKPIIDTLDLYHNQGVDPRAIAVSFKELAENNPNAELEIVAIEKRGKDKILLRAKTVITANKSELSKEYFINYNQLKALAEKDFQALIAYRENQIRRLENMITTALERPNFYVENYQNQGNTNMSDNRHIQTDRDYRETHVNDQGTYVEGYYYNNPKQKQTLTEAAAEIQTLLELLDKTHSTNTTMGKMALATEAIAQIENNPALTSRILSALTTGGVKAFEQLLSHPAASFVIGALEDWEKTKNS